MRWIWIDKFIEFESGRRAVSIKNVTLAEEHVHDHFPGYPMHPATLMIEGMAQTGGVLVGEAFDFREKVVLAKVTRARFYCHVLPGDQIRFEANVMGEVRPEGASIEGKITRNGELVAEISMMYAHLDQSRAPLELGDENFVFNEDFIRMLRMRQLNQLKPSAQAARDVKVPLRRRIVITGLGVLTPAGNSASALAEAVRTGRSAVTAVSRFDAGPFPSRVAGEIREFDATAGIRKDQARYVKKMAKVMAVDIQLAVAAANLAILDTGLPLGDAKANEPVLPTIDHARLGMVFGTSFIPTELDDLAEPARASFVDGKFSLKGWGSGGIPKMFPLWLLKYLPNMHACHTGILWDAQGPSNSLTTNEAGGLLALDECARIIKRGWADWMLAGGAESRISPVLMMRYNLVGRLTTCNDDPPTACRPFDVTRTGQVAGEGAAVIVLEAREAAEKRGARIYGEVLGTGAGQTTAGINAVDADGRAVAVAVRQALAMAGVQPAALGAIVAHGTAFTPQDRSESAGLVAALGPAARKVPVTATKGVTGNMGAASGLADLAAALLFLKDGQVPPIVNCTHPDTEAGLNFVSGKPVALTSDLVLVTANAIGGQAAAVVVKLNR